MKIYDRLIRQHRARVSFRILLTFLLTFIVARTYVLFATHGVFEDPYLYIRGYHIHHLNYGIVIMSIAGFLALVYPGDEHRLKIGTLYGFGLGLTFDEFGMWMKLDDDYWTRTSYDAVVVIAVLFVSFVYFPQFWHFWIRYYRKQLENFQHKLFSKK